MSIAIGTPAAAAVRSSPSSIARAMPRRRCVGATVTAEMAQDGMPRPPGTVSSPIHDAIVATGASGIGADGS